MSEERITILDDISEIVCAAKGCGLDENFIKRGPVCGRIEALSERLDISPCQSVLLALLVERSAYEALSLHDMAEFFGIQTVQMLQKLDALDDLEAHGYLSSRMEEGQMVFRVPWQVLHSFAYDMVYSPKEGIPQETERVIVTLFCLFNFFLHLTRRLSLSKNSERGLPPLLTRRISLCSNGCVTKCPLNGQSSESCCICCAANISVGGSIVPASF